MRASNKSNDLTSELPGVLSRTDTAPGRRLRREVGDESKDAKPLSVGWYTEYLWGIIEFRPGVQTSSIYDHCHIRVPFNR